MTPCGLQSLSRVSWSIGLVAFCVIYFGLQLIRGAIA
jgi:hypothetical protein